MDKISSSNSQSRPIWERQKGPKGHRSAVDRALEAHRKRAEERHSRTQNRLDMVREMNNQFFPEPKVSKMPATIKDDFRVSPTPMEQGMQNLQQEVPQEIPQFNPRQIDNIYDEAQLRPSSDSAMIMVEKEMIANPEDGPLDDIPKGSYVDYTV